MAETISSANGMEMTLKDSGIIDMTPASLLQHNALVKHSHALRSLKECSSDEQPVALDSSARANSTPPTNYSTPTPTPPAIATFRCDRCDNFETTSRASLLLHVVQCLSNHAHLKTEGAELENFSVGAAVPHVDHNAGSSNDVTKLLPDTPNNVPTNMSVITTNGNGNASSPTASSSSSSSSRKVFECDVCNMKFSNGANMRRHKMRHTGVKPYECRVCQKRFFRKDHLAEHFTTHTKTLPYHCPICNRGFQRQIAMRAHFQNEHVGQHDLVKTCPLCSYRAGSMKSLRIHFFNRHGIDLDNPGPGGSSSLLLALESQASQVAAAAAAASFVPGLNAVAAAAAAASQNANSSMTTHQSDSGESMRSLENATPPMHFLTPHVEISTLSENGTDLFNVTWNALLNCKLGKSTDAAFLCAFDLQGNANASTGVELMETKSGSRGGERDTITGSKSPVPPPPQEHPIDCNTKSLPSSTSHVGLHLNACASPKTHHHENHITPSISLIPIKQEPLGEDLSTDSNKARHKISPSTPSDQMNGGDSNESEFSSPNNRLTSLIKVSPLKSLLREDLKRRICAKANNRITRNAGVLDNNNVVQASVVGGNTNNSSTCNSTPICNGTITSTGQETESNLLNRKQILTCLFCGIEFPDETLYFLHKGCHCESNPWKCNICGEQCNNVYEFNSHLLSKSHQ
ncbi:asparagine-rich zinc finger protein AZF1 isoform X1 [Rhagoletis pomonella]|uniref:asparagine-rich zinc finger protein AZF1 isoform X1 n=1 Tax=Rhagoletis pomonella TaxID=28610 RepID=UPI001785A0D3|nr:asparagine-rich zinc finger protein AZF1 isoform X1 [Rhagoletis pomonella]XP_036330146.1 asparagine-rich zinc finger protein AZF1 isoform X1 [Rhagoletis pomonella]XP_036330147.1 asparagine-rich zinc finger protein AZF1 isoform X1 [Rhagoletis pomonella]